MLGVTGIVDRGQELAVPPRPTHVLRRTRSSPRHTPWIPNPRLGSQHLLHGDVMGPAITEVIDIDQPVTLLDQAKQLEGRPRVGRVRNLVSVDLVI
jgi:hypothetical protein